MKKSTQKLSKSMEAGMPPAKKSKDSAFKPKYAKSMKLKKNVDPRKEVRKPKKMDSSFYAMKGIEYRVMKEDAHPLVAESDAIVYDFLKAIYEGDNVDIALFDTDPYEDHPDDESVIKKSKNRKANENASAGATSAGGIATSVSPMGKPRKRSELFADAATYSKKLKEFAPNIPARPAPIKPMPRPSTLAPTTSPTPLPRPSASPTSAPTTPIKPMPKPSTLAPTTSPRPMPKPSVSAPITSPRPNPRPWGNNLEIDYE